MNLFKEYAAEYLDNGYSVIPDKFRSKMPAIKNWNHYCNILPMYLFLLF